jgi:AraC-like DNA-binding protein
MIINRHFDINFYEFVNNYRIEETQKILVDPKNKDKTITDVYLEVGFNSKSVFNTFFKKIVGQAPAEYRQCAKPQNWLTSSRRSIVLFSAQAFWSGRFIAALNCHLV